MKKFVLAMAAAFMVFAAAAGSASAYSYSDFIVAIYNQDSTEELAINLGNIDNLLGSLTNEETVVWNNDLSNYFGDGDTEGWLVGAFATSSKTDKTAYIATADVPSINQNLSTALGIYANGRTIYRKYDDEADVTGLAIGATTDRNSYDYLMNQQGNATGYYSALVPTAAPQGSFMTLDGELDYAELYLYGVNGIDLMNNGNAAAILKVYADGTITMATAVPVPGTLILLASGILGLVGIRRKNS